MGRSNPNTYVPNPAKITLNWAGGKGLFSIYDKEKKERVLLDLPLRFAWVEDFAAITGYHEIDDNSGFFIQSNELGSIKDGDFTVFHYDRVGSGDDAKFKKVVDFEGPYSEIKDAVKSKEYGGKYTTVVYGVADGDNGPIKGGDIIRIELSGAALNAWIDKGFNHYDGGICIEEAVAKKKGAVNYFQPIFKQEQISQELDGLATEADKAVSAWYNQTAADAPETAPSGTEPSDPPDEYEDDIPF
jgi:hypothetical protein